MKQVAERMAFTVLNDWRLAIPPEHVEILIEVAEIAEWMRPMMRERP